MTVAIVIPARFASTRLPYKMLLNQTGKPLIQHTYEQAKKSTLADRILIATDDERIALAAKQFDAEVVLTSIHHPTGTDRLAEVLTHTLMDVDFILNIQGDEPELDPQHIDTLITLFHQSQAEVGTLVTRFPKDKTQGQGSPLDPNCVKAVLGAPITDNHNHTIGHQALYFSRSVVPFPREENGVVHHPERYFLHLGIYAYRPDFLKKYIHLPQGPLELSEKLEQLRVLENGYRIVASIVDHATPGIDTQADYNQFVQRWWQKQNDAFYLKSQTCS